MPSFPLLDVAIGMIFVYLLASLICSSINEGLESLLRNRANDLEAGIRILLGDSPNTSWRQTILLWWKSFLPWVNSINTPSITQQFYKHPLIRGLFRTEERLPSYIPARNFALAVMDLVGRDLGMNFLQGATPSTPATPVPATPVPAAPVPTAPLPTAPASPPVAVPKDLKTTIQLLFEAAGNDAEQARINIENWFNSSMDRVSGWYKARTQWILFVIGIFVTVFANLDSIGLFQALSHEKDLQTVVGTAQAFAHQPQPSGQESNDGYMRAIRQLNSLQLPIGWVNETDLTSEVEKSRIPPIWNSSSSKDCVTSAACAHPLEWSLYLFSLHWFGWLLTAAAISLGAPFWFDTLNRFIVVRSTVKPQEKSPEEASKDHA